MAGVNLPWPGSADPPLDGEIYRFTDPESSSRPEKNSAAWIVGHTLPDGVRVAHFGSWRRENGPWTWCEADELSADQHAELDRLKAAAERDRERRYAQARLEAARLWEAATPVKHREHPYLTRKQVDGQAMVRMTAENVLLVPLRDTAGNLHTLIRIWPDGTKRLLEDGDPRGHFCRIGPKPAGKIWLAEGISTALTVATATGQATVCCGAAGNLPRVARALRAKYPDMELVIAADCGPKGQQGATEALAAAGPAARILTPVHPQAGDGFDWNDLMQVAGLEAVKAQLQAATTAPVEPEPLRRELPPPEPYPLEVLGPVLHPAALALRRIIQAPDALIAQSLLAAAALCVQPHANVIIDGRVSPLSIFAITVGASGERKTAVDSLALKPVADRQRELVEAYREDTRSHKRELKEFEKCERELLGKKVVDLGAVKANRDQKKAALDGLGDPPEPPLLPNLLAADPTSEGLFKLFANGQPSLGLFSDEGALFIGGAALMKEVRLRTIGALSKLWDGRPLDRVRSGDGASVLFDRRLSLHLMMQPLVAAELFNDPIFADQGFLSRVLCAWPETTAGTRRYRSEDASQDPAIRRYWDVLKALLERPYPLREGTRNELMPRLLPLADPAKAAWIHYCDTIEAQLGSGQPLEPIRGFANKTAEHAARIAGVLAVIENQAATVIELPHVQAGIALMDYYLTEMLRIQETGAGNPDIRLAEKLLDWARGFEVIYLRLIYRHGPNAIREAETAKRLCRLLEEHGWLSKIEGGAVIDGIHRRNAWRVNR
ncbi:MAG: DUF3987 domain-containing protein [Candidatus Competibacter sp.]|nr:DUF3987 domain-containing protein [Candidatus Competibacter sp.]